jgi:small-conductance mechanosensitive channel
VVFVLLLHFISDFSSVVTFAGFITAGLAVALQGVLLSLVAHFLFYGRYGVRAGDRVNVAGVTGDIVQIGMVRFYLRELHSNAQGVLEPTGKVVAFPNSILFQPSAFYKYVG